MVGDHFVGQIVFVDITHVLNRLSADLPCSDQFHVVEPTIAIEALFLCFFPQAGNSGGPCIVRGASEQPLVVWSIGAFL
jgi:hypothetical protein